MRIARPLRMGESLPDHLCWQAEPESCKAWLRDNWPAVPDLRQREKLQFEAPEVTIGFDEDLTQQTHATGKTATYKVEYGQWPVVRRFPVTISLGDGRSVFVADQFDLERGNYYIAWGPKDTRNRLTVCLVLRQWIEEELGVVDCDKFARMLEQQMPQEYAEHLCASSQSRSATPTERQIEQFRMGVLLRAGLPATRDTALYLLLRMLGRSTEDIEVRPTVGLLVTSIAVRRNTLIHPGYQHAYAQVIHQVVGHAPWTRYALVEEAYRCMKAHEEWLSCVPTRNWPTPGHPRIGKPAVKLREGDLRATLDERDALVRAFIHGQISRDEMHARALELRNTEQHGRITLQEAVLEKKRMDERVRRKLKPPRQG